MTTPPHQPWPPSSGSSPSTITVGGPNGVVIQGDRVQVGGTVVNPGTPSPAVLQSAPYPAQLAQLPASRGSALEMELFRNPRRLPRCLLGGGLFMGMMAIVLALPALGLPVVLSVMASVSAVLAIGGAFVLGGKARKLQRTQALPPQLELDLLELAHRSGGQLCVPETARALKIPLDDAQEALERLAKRGHAELEVKEAGELVYKISQGAQQASTPALPSS